MKDIATKMINNVSFILNNFDRNIYHNLNNYFCIDIYHSKIKILKYTVEFYNRCKSCYKNPGRN